RVLPAVPEIRKAADAARVSSPPQSSVHTPMLRPVSTDAAQLSVGPFAALPGPERISLQTSAETPKHQAPDFSPAASAPKAPALPSIRSHAGPASPVAASPSTVGGRVPHAPSPKASA